MTDTSNPLLPITLVFNDAGARGKQKPTKATAEFGTAFTVQLSRYGDVTVHALPGVTVKRRSGKSDFSDKRVINMDQPSFSLWGVTVVASDENTVEVHSDGNISVTRRPAPGQPWRTAGQIIREVAARQVQQARR